MPIEVIRCPHCDARVMPMADGLCPACRTKTDQPPNLDQDPPREAPDAWGTYTESIHSDFVESSVDLLREIEQPYLKSRATAVARLKHYATGDSANADRIRQDLLPRYLAAIRQIESAGEQRDVASLIEFARLREESWRCLADALEENDPDKLAHHEELWGCSEKLRNADSAETSTKSIKEFQRALSTFTPYLIVTPTIVFANILLYATMVATDAHRLEPTVETALNWGANFGPATANGQWWRVVTCMFLHFGIIHLAFNMWVLWDVGRLVERLVGNVAFLILYFLSGISGSLASLSWHPSVVSGGASGAVFGVVGALLGLIAFRRDTIPAPVFKHLSKSMTAFVVYNMIFGIFVPGIDIAAHLGGLVAGFACGLILSQPLSRDMVGRRKLRNAVVSMAGGAALMLWAFVLPNFTRAASPPMCTDARVVKLLEQVIRTTPLATKLKSIGNHREVSYDSDARVRNGECVAHTEDGPVTIRFVVEWENPYESRFQVRVLPAELPACTDPIVVDLLEQVFRSTHPDVKLKSIDRHRELSYESDAGIRHGECVANTDEGGVPVRYIVEWQDPKKGSYQVRIPPDKLPSCTDPEVVKLVDQVVRDSLAGINLKSIVGHREVAYDDASNVRQGECVAHTDAGPVSFRFIVEWQNRLRGIFQVRAVALPQEDVAAGNR